MYTLLENVHIEGPYVLVAHSGGGLLARLFAGRHSEDVVGMVLVDTGHEEFPTRAQEVVAAEEWQLYRDLYADRRAALISEEEVAAAQAGVAAVSLGDMPLVVLSARLERPRLPVDINVRFQEVMLKLQREKLAPLSSRGVHIDVPNSGHAIQNDRPEVVVDAARQVVEAVRQDMR